MPQPRFVEVVDVGAEASTTIASLLASGQGLIGTLHFNVSDYLNSTYGREALLSTLTAYNVTPNWDDWQFAELARSINLTTPDVPAPQGTARHLLLFGILLLLSRETVLRWRVARLVRKYGHSA